MLTRPIQRTEKSVTPFACAKAAPLFLPLMGGVRPIFAEVISMSKPKIGVGVHAHPESNVLGDLVGIIEKAGIGLIRLFIWAIQAIYRLISALIGLTIVTLLNLIRRETVICLTVFMIVFPPVAVFWHYIFNSYILISFPLVLMCITGCFGLRVFVKRGQSMVFNIYMYCCAYWRCNSFGVHIN